MTVVLDGRSLTVAELVLVSRHGEQVELAPAAIAAMEHARSIVGDVVDEGHAAYGITTGVGVRKRVMVEADGHDRLLVRQHLIGQGAPVPEDVGRATALRLANALARGSTAARPELARAVVECLNERRVPPIRALGSVGQGDLAPMADLAEGIFARLEPARGEAIAVVNQNALSTAWGALAVVDAVRLLDALDIAAALDIEALGAAPDAFDSALADTRESAGFRLTLERLETLLAGSTRVARNLQDPLVFRTVPFLHGAARDALSFSSAQVATELNAVQSNPVVLPDGRIVSCGVFELAALATALDLARIALGQVLAAAAERAVKLLQAPLTGLPEGLGARSGLAESALSELGIAIQAFAAEARLLAPPVSLELVSTTQAEGIEDRITMAPLAARRLAEMVDLGSRVVAVELLLAAQACELRGLDSIGPRTRATFDRVRASAGFVAEGDPLPALEPLVHVVRSGGLDG